MLDLIIRGGEVVTPQGVGNFDVAVEGETIAAVTAPGTLADDTAQRVIDANGKIVMPGGVDPHVHMHHPWIKPDGTTLTTAGPDQVGRAALYGGTTTLIDFAYWFEEHDTALDAIEARDKHFVGRSYCDWAYHLMLHSEPRHTFTGQLAEAIQAGYPTLKIFTTNILPGRSGRMIDFGDIWEAFQVLAAEGGLGVIHAEDNDIVICNHQGELFAVDNVCSHAYALLHEGFLRRFRLICPLHGASFDIRDGCALGKPAKEPLTCYPVRVSDGQIQVSLASGGA